jgi:hypothetical protein
MSAAALDLGDAGDHIAIAEFDCPAGLSATGIWLHYRRSKNGGSPQLFLLANGGQQVQAVGSPPSTWTRFSIVVTWLGSGSRVTVSSNASEVVRDTPTTQSPCPGQLVANVGLSASPGASGSANFDDVLLEINPTN